MDKIEVYLGVGANLGDPLATIKKTWQLLSQQTEIFELRSSNLYLTEPVSSIPQPYFLNAIWSFKTSWTAHELLKKLQEIEWMMGKRPKGKMDPRLLDLDILFYGQKQITGDTLTIPHLHWQERAFVLIPLLDLTSTIDLPDGQQVHILDTISALPNSKKQGVQRAYQRSILCV